MHRHGYVVAEGVIVEDIDAKEEYNVDQPAADGHLIRCKEEGRPRDVKLGDVPSNRHEEKLSKREKYTARWLETGSCQCVHLAWYEESSNSLDHLLQRIHV